MSRRMNDATLKLGVTGRRHIVPEARAAVEKSARVFFETLASEFSGTLSLYDGLAVGADSIAARAALDARRIATRATIYLVALLPRDRESYARDFKSAPREDGRSELDDYRELLRESDSIVEQLAPLEDPLSGYVWLGEELVERCDAILAFWNGDASIRKPGGTVDVALKALERGKTVFAISTPELKRKKGADGTKIYVPDPIEGAGNLAVLRSSSAPFVFEPIEKGVKRVRAFLRGAK